MVNEQSASQAFDVALLGSGIACTLTLLSFLERLAAPTSHTHAKNAQPVRIAVIERETEFWRGMPYGRRSSRNSLIITTLGEFVPDAEREDFIAWLKANKDKWAARMREANADVTDHWFADNQKAMDAGEWDEIYTPRVLYGDYVEEKTDAAIARAKATGQAMVTTLTGEATRVRASGRGYEVSLGATSGPSALTARLVVLTVGSPPVRSILPASLNPGFHYVADAYAPSLPANLEAIRSHLASLPQADRNLLIVGANATCLELNYLIANDPALRGTLNRMATLSLGGTFPRRMTRNRFRAESFPRLEALQKAPAIDPDAIIVAAEADVAALDAAGVKDVGDTLHHLSGQLVSLMERLTPAQQKDFHHRHGMRFTRLIRRAGSEYRDAAQGLIDSGKLDVLRGEFRGIANAARPGFATLTYVGPQGEAPHPMDFAVVINTAGFEELSASSSNPVLADIVRGGLAGVNETGRGFRVNEKLEAAPGLFVNGPLLGGVFNGTAQYWHVENVRRIHTLAQILGPALDESLAQNMLAAAS